MESLSTSTKEALLLTAGELFADHGVEGTSIRTIAEKCQANIAAVNYHFGGKENLHLAVIRYVLEKTRCSRARELMGREHTWAQNPQQCAEAVYAIVEECVQQYFTGIHPRWYGRLFMRILLRPTPANWKIVEELLLPEFSMMREVMRRCRPGMSAREAELWTDSLIGQLAHYIFAEEFMRMTPGRHAFDTKFQKSILNHVSKMLIRGLELPLPAFLKEEADHA